MNTNPTPDRVTKLEPHQVFVFGSNTEGIHGAGAAAFAHKNFGAIMGVPCGHQGQSYAIPTKDLRKGMRSIPIDTMQGDVWLFLDYAQRHPELEFLVTRLGTELAGYTLNEMASLFDGEDLPDNVRLPQEFLDRI
jgi:hypothetical protein